MSKSLVISIVYIQFDICYACKLKLRQLILAFLLIVTELWIKRNRVTTTTYNKAITDMLLIVFIRKNNYKMISELVNITKSNKKYVLYRE